MRLVSFDGGRRAGVRAGDRVHDTGMNMLELLSEWPRVRERFASPDGAGVPLRDLKLSAPVPQPPKIVCIGQNYLDHVREQDAQLPERPVIFAKFRTAVVGPGEPVWWPEGVTETVDWEVELAVVIGARARDVSRDRAASVIAGYTIGNDVSARDVQLKLGGGQWVRGKSLDSFCPLGPEIVTEDELGDPGSLRLWLDLNGTRMQDSTTSNLIFGVPELIEFCSRSFTLEPGDVLLTGTPPGVGAFRQPPVFLKAGDRMVAGIDGIGRLESPVRGPVPASGLIRPATSGSERRPT